MRVPPAIKWMKSARVDVKPHFNSKVMDAIYEVRGQKREWHGADTQKAITTSAVALIDDMK
jgi:hypothetical protein